MTNKNFKKDIVTMYTYALEEEVKTEQAKEPVGIHEFLGSVIVLINRYAVVLIKEDKEYTALPASVFTDKAVFDKGIEIKALVHENEYIIVCAKVLHELCVQENIHADLSEFIERIKKQKNPGKEIKSFYVSEDLVVKFFKELRYARALYRPEKLHGSLEKYNGKRVLTGKITNFRKAMRNAISWKYEISEDAVKGTYIDEAMDILVSKKILNMEKITDCSRYVSVPQYFVAGGAAYFMNEKGYGNFFNI